MAEDWLNENMPAVSVNFDIMAEDWLNGIMPAVAVNFNTAESLERSIARVRRPPRAAMKMLRDMGEHKSFWFALRKHGNEQAALRWLSTLHAKSNWAEQKHSEFERLRKEYLRLLDSIRVFDPGFQDGGSR